MARLLVSVRSLDEAREAFVAGAHLIDLKEPTLGSLGRVSDQITQSIAHHLGHSVALSMALGELADWHETELVQIPPGIAYAKLGLAGCAARDDWPTHWQRALRTLPAGCRPVAVVYADWRHVQAPSPDMVLSQAVPLGCRAVLVDTCDKASGNVFDHWPPREVAHFLARAGQFGLTTVLAGSLTFDVIEPALGCLPDYLAVRGAVCGGTRQSALVGDKVRQWIERCNVKNRSTQAVWI